LAPASDAILDTFEAAPRALERRALSWIAAVLALAIPLLATHHGEFWPLSIYPMFSSAGKPWTRSLARDVTGVSEAELWSARTFPEDLPGKPVLMHTLGVSQNDFSLMMKDTKVWDADAEQRLRKFFGEYLTSHDVLVFRVTGTLGQNGHGGSMQLSTQPFVWLTRERTVFNPHLPPAPHARAHDPLLHEGPRS
jgi:hypothetical protein